MRYTIDVVCECHECGIVGVQKSPYLCTVKIKH